MICSTLSPGFQQNQLDNQTLKHSSGQQLVEAFSAPWLPSTLMEIYTRENSGASIPGVGDLRVTREAADGARCAILNIRQKLLPAPLVSAVAGGGLGLSWAVGARRIDLTAYPDGEVTYIAVDSGVVLEDGTAIELRDDGTHVANEKPFDHYFPQLMGE